MKKIELDQFCHISYVGGLSSSPNEDKLCFIKSIADHEQNKYETDLWLYEQGQIHKLTNGHSDRNPKWINADHVAFFSRRVKDEKVQKTRIYSISTHGGEAELLHETFHQIQSFELLDEHHWLVQISYEPGRFELEQQQDGKALEKFMTDHEGWKEFDEIPFWANGDGFTNKKRSALGILDLKANKIELLTDHLTDVYHYDLNKEKNQVAYIYNAFKNVMSIYDSIGTIDLKTKIKKEISHEEVFVYERCQYNPEGQLVVLGKSGQQYGLNENASFFLINPLTSEAKCISPNFDGSTGCSVGSDAKYGAGGGSDWIFTEEGMIFSATIGYSCNLMLLKQDGSVVPYTEIDGAIFDYQRLNGKIVFNALKDAVPMELYELDSEIKPLTHYNEAYGKSIFLSIPEHIQFTQPDGTEIDGWIMKPRGFNSSRRYPAILNIHGGPKTVYGSVYYHEMQYWASEGFVVMYCNPRGSDGKGNAFADIRGKYGTIDYDDLMAFVDVVLEKYPFVKHDQIGLTGGSYGGYMTNWIVGHTDRFKAAATQRSISNWISMYGTTDIGYFFVQDQIAANPWDNFELLWDRSPMKYADKIKTPLLVLHSEEDYRCWLTEGIQMFTSLKTNNVPAKMVMFHGENHELSRSGKPKNRVKRLKEITEWMVKYISTPVED